MKSARTIKDIVFFVIIDSDIFYATKNSLYTNHNIFISQIEDMLMDMAKCNDYYILLFSSGNGYLLHVNKQIVKIPYWCHNATAYNDFLAIYDYDYELLTQLNNVYDIEKKVLIFSEWYKGSCVVIYPYYIYICIKDFFLIDISTNNKWQFSIEDFPNYINGFFREQEADIKQIIGVYNNILWVHVGGFRLIGIDVETGKMMHYVENILKGKEGNNFLDEKEGILKTLSYDYYAEFDLTTLKFRRQTQINCPEDIIIRSSNFYSDDKHLYFCGYYQKSDRPNAFGIFDTEKAEIIWYDTTKDDLGYFYNPPQANDKLLAVLDDKHNLLVYDRE
jgi:hypothetical protein